MLFEIKSMNELCNFVDINTTNCVFNFIWELFSNIFNVISFFLEVKNQLLFKYRNTNNNICNTSYVYL